MNFEEQNERFSFLLMPFQSLPQRFSFPSSPLHHCPPAALSSQDLYSRFIESFLSFSHSVEGLSEFRKYPLHPFNANKIINASLLCIVIFVCMITFIIITSLKVTNMEVGITFSISWCLSKWNIGRGFILPFPFNSFVCSVTDTRPGG